MTLVTDATGNDLTYKISGWFVDVVSFYHYGISYVINLSYLRFGPRQFVEF